MASDLVDWVNTPGAAYLGSHVRHAPADGLFGRVGGLDGLLGTRR